MKNLTTINHVKNQFQVNDFVEKTISQINKDLNGLSFEILALNFEDSSSRLIEVTIKLIPILKKLGKESQLQQFIYQVDLGEKKWMNFISTQNFKELSEQIIIREAQKVYLKEMFKNT